MLPKAKKSYSQNWLVDETAVQKIVTAAGIRSGETVLEIGPGTGLLTKELVKAGAKVMAVEADDSLIEPLKEQFADQVEVVHGDALVTTPPEGDYKLVANIPYSITSDILRRYLTHEHPPTRMILLVQKEVADRIVAGPGEMSVLSVMCQLYAQCKKVFKVPAGAFRPIPKVDSAVIQLDLYPENKENVSLESVIAVAKRGFSSRRKQLQKNIGPGTKEVLEGMGLDPKIRAQDLTIDNWKELTHNLSKRT